MNTTTRRRGARRTHHPEVHRDLGGRWRWSCGCGAGASNGANAVDWHWTVAAALVHQQYQPGE